MLLFLILSVQCFRSVNTKFNNLDSSSANLMFFMKILQKSQSALNDFRNRQTDISRKKHRKLTPSFIECTDKCTITLMMHFL